MVFATPPETDPRPLVSGFVATKEPTAISGIKTEGMGTLIQIVLDEIARQEPDSIILKVDREFLADNRITFPRELEAFIGDRLSEGKKVNAVICGNIPVQNWHLVFEKYKGQNIEVYFCEYNYKLVPNCTKLPI